MKKVAIYPGTFDPITNGHVDLINRALGIFDEVIVAVSTGFGKKTMFDIKQRKSMIDVAFLDNVDVQVVSFDGLLVDVANKYNATAVLRGVRTVADFEYEYQMAKINSKLDSSVQTVFLTPNEAMSCVSSTMIRAVASHNLAKLKGFVPKNVFIELQKKVGK